MPTTKSVLKHRSASHSSSTEKNALQQQHSITSTVSLCSASNKYNRGKLKRMDSIDFDQSIVSIPSTCSELGSSNYMGQTNNPNLLSPSSCHPSYNRSASCNDSERDISLEGRLRVHQFQKTHSASSPLAPGKKLLRFSDGGLGRTAGLLQEEMDNKARSSSCLPVSKSRGSLSPKTSHTHLDRSFDSHHRRVSFEKTSSISPNRSQEKQETSGTFFKSKGVKKLERFFSTDSSNSASKNSSVTSPHKEEVCGTVSSNSNSSTSSDTRSRKSQFRRAISLFSLNCDKETEKEKREKTSQRILRPPTRHVYRRGLSGLPIECTSRSMGMVY